MYGVEQELVIDRTLWLRSVQGAAMTELRRTGTNECRIVKMTHSSAIVSGFTLSNGAGANGAGARVEGGYLYNCRVGGHAGDGVSLGEMARARIANCLVTGNSGAGITGSGAVINCTVVSNGGDAIEAGAVYNSIADGTIDSAEVRFTLAPVLYAGLGNRSGAASFVDAGGGNYRLAVGSVGIDAGRNEYNTLSTDLDGLPRIFSLIDLGAYEKTSQGGLAVSLMSDPNPLPAGDALRYTVYVVNQGPNGAQGVSVLCPLVQVQCRSNSAGGAYQSDTGHWAVGDLPAGQIRQLQLWCLVDEAGYITNSAMVAAAASDPIQAGYGVSTNITRVLGSVSITNVSANTGGDSAVVEWESAVGMSYNVYAHDGPLVEEPEWTLRANMVASEEVRSYMDSLASAQGADRRYYQVAYPGHAPSASNIWAVVRKEVPPGFTLLSPPVRMDRRFDGELGAVLADALNGHDGGGGAGADELYILQGDGSWRTLYLDGSKTWCEMNGTPSGYELPAGQGVWLARRAGTAARLTFTGRVGNDGSATAALQPGFNLIGLSEGKDISLSQTLATAQPKGGAYEETADQLILPLPNGSWQYLMFVTNWGAPYDGNWFDLGTYEIVPASETLAPGSAYYYLRRGGATQLEY